MFTSNKSIRKKKDRKNTVLEPKFGLFFNI